MYRQKSFDLKMSKIMLIFNTKQEYGVISISWYFIAIAVPHSCSVSSSCPSEWMLERGKWQTASWGGLERGNLWLWQPLLLLQPDQTGVWACMWMLVTNAFLSLTLISSFSTCLSLRTRVSFFCSAALWRAVVTDTGVLDQTGTKSRCLALNGWTVQPGTPFR